MMLMKTRMASDRLQAPSYLVTYCLCLYSDSEVFLSDFSASLLRRTSHFHFQYCYKSVPRPQVHEQPWRTVSSSLEPLALLGSDSKYPSRRSDCDAEHRSRGALLLLCAPSITSVLSYFPVPQHTRRHLIVEDIIAIGGLPFGLLKGCLSSSAAFVLLRRLSPEQQHTQEQ